MTLTLGLRYEFFSPYSEKYNRMENLEVPQYFAGPPTVMTPGKPGVPSGLVNPAKDLFSPRAGLAWKPWKDRSTVVRLGYGIFYNGSVYGQFPSQLAAQAVENLSLINSTSAPVSHPDHTRQRFPDAGNEHLRGGPELSPRLRADMERVDAAEPAQGARSGR